MRALGHRISSYRAFHPQLQQKTYARAELLSSDHRPVYSIFSVATHEVDEAKKAIMAKEIAKDLRGKVSANGTGDLEKSFVQVGLDDAKTNEKYGLLIPTGKTETARREFDSGLGAVCTALTITGKGAPPPMPLPRSTPPTVLVRPGERSGDA